MIPIKGIMRNLLF